MSQELRVLIIEDDPDVRLGCEQAMMLADLPVEGVGSAEEGLARVKAGFPGIVVTDMRLPKADGMEVLRRCQAMDADLPVIIITGHGDVETAVRALKNGALDFLQKPFSREDLLAALDSAWQQPRHTPVRSEEVELACARIERLTKREQQVLLGLVKGQPNKVIAYDLGLSPRTVELYRANAMRKLEVRSLPEMLHLAFLADLGNGSEAA